MPLAAGVMMPTAELRDLAGQPWSLASAWTSGEALVLLGHGDCRTTRLTLPCVDLIHRRRLPGTTVVAVLQDHADAARAVCRDLELELPVRLEDDPYALAAALGVNVVPTLFQVAQDGRLTRVIEAFDKRALEALALHFNGRPLFEPGDAGPDRRPG